MQYFQIVTAVYGDNPQMVDQMVHRDKALAHVAEALMVPEDVLVTTSEREKIAEAQAQAQTAQMVASAAMAAPEQAVAAAEAAGGMAS
jgi:hypothetical protein